MSTTMENESNKMAEKRAKRFWIALVVFLFIIQSTIMGSVMHLAIGDPSSMAGEAVAFLADGMLSDDDESGPVAGSGVSQHWDTPDVMQTMLS